MFLNQQQSTEEIAGRLALEHHRTIVSVNTIYREIYRGRFNEVYPMAAAA
jgi:transposase, IS30 family